MGKTADHFFIVSSFFPLRGAPHTPYNHPHATPTPFQLHLCPRRDTKILTYPRGPHSGRVTLSFPISMLATGTSPPPRRAVKWKILDFSLGNLSMNKDGNNSAGKYINKKRSGHRLESFTYNNQYVNIHIKKKNTCYILQGTLLLYPP